MITLGIDPGWASCGVAASQEGKILRSFHFVPRDHAKGGSLDEVLGWLTTELDEVDGVELDCIRGAYIERYVAYAGVTSAASEDILMFIGALKYWLENKGIPVTMVRAIDWKPKVAKYLVRKFGANNPNASFDKKFSIFAASTLSSKQFKTDHEADAVCLSYLGEIDEYNKEHKK